MPCRSGETIWPRLGVYSTARRSCGIVIVLLLLIVLLLTWTLISQPTEHPDSADGWPCAAAPFHAANAMSLVTYLTSSQVGRFGPLFR
jgi:hypothetical protein